MSVVVQIFEEIGSVLCVVLVSQNWEVIGEFDQCCCQVVDEVMFDVQDEVILWVWMEELLVLYCELIDVCQGEQCKLVIDLIQLNQLK